MRLSDLKTGYMVELRNDNRMVVLKNFNGEEDIFKDFEKDKWLPFGVYDADMTYRNNKTFDIMQVMKSPYPCAREEVIWEREEEEEKVDWTKVKKDTLIWVRESKDEEWKPRYFAFYADDVVYAFNSGRTSKTADGSFDYMGWNFAKEYRESDGRED